MSGNKIVDIDIKKILVDNMGHNSKNKQFDKGLL